VTGQARPRKQPEVRYCRTCLALTGLYIELVDGTCQRCEQRRARKLAANERALAAYERALAASRDDSFIVMGDRKYCRFCLRRAQVYNELRPDGSCPDCAQAAQPNRRQPGAGPAPGRRGRTIPGSWVRFMSGGLPGLGKKKGRR
jgi:hypothetical protein